jgi:hypothetical protein
MLWEAKFIAAREKAAEKVAVVPVKVGDWVRTEERVSGKLDPRWSIEKKRVRAVRGNVVFVVKESRPYHAQQVKRVPEGDHESELVEGELGAEVQTEQAVLGAVSSEADGVESGVVEQVPITSGVATGRQPRVPGESVFFQSLHQPRLGKRTIRPTAKARAAGGGEEGGGDG